VSLAEARPTHSIGIIAVARLQLEYSPVGWRPKSFFADATTMVASATTPGAFRNPMTRFWSTPHTEIGPPSGWSHTGARAHPALPRRHILTMRRRPTSSSGAISNDRQAPSTIECPYSCLRVLLVCLLGGPVRLARSGPPARPPDDTTELLIGARA
jgi:hypothetical protein